MEATQLLLPTDIEGRLALPTQLRVRASWEEFLELLPECAYRVEYDQHEMISFMGYATEQHEALVLNLAFILKTLLTPQQYQCYASNLALHVPGQAKRYFNADLTVIEGSPQFKNLQGSMRAVTNPVLLVEVLSASTYDYDLATKASAYREIPSLQQLLFIDSESTHIISQIRQTDTQQWLLSEYRQTVDVVPLFNGATFRVWEAYGVETENK